MMKNLYYTFPIVLSSIVFSGCASTDIEKRLEKNFVYQCSLQLFDKLDKKVTGADAEKICEAAHRAEMAEDARKSTITSAVTVAPAPMATPAPAAKAETATPAKEATVSDSDEVKPEPTPKK